MAKDKELTIDDKFDLLLQVLAQKQETGITKDALKEILAETGQSTAASMQRALKPENTTHPNISVFRPKGGADPVLPYEVLYNGFPVHKAVETHHDRELELLLMVKPGEYTVIRKDGTPMTVTAKAEHDANGVITKMSIQFPVSREDKAIVPAMQVLLYQMAYAGTAHPKQLFVAATTEHMQTMFADAVPA
jgi:hypothetical protein